PDNLKQQSDFIIEHLPDKRIVAIGEGGLDKLKGASMEIQTAAFMAQMTLSMEYDLPLILHNVRMTDKILAVKKQFRPGQPWIWHGFRGKPEQAEQLQGKGLYLSFGEFYSDEAMRAVSDDRLFLETDESSLDIEELLYRAARVRGVGVETLRETIRRNIQNVFFRA
ncbi:hydrolase TatD, partial [Bacteroides finegoldii]